MPRGGCFAFPSLLVRPDATDSCGMRAPRSSQIVQVDHAQTVSASREHQHLVVHCSSSQPMLPRPHQPVRGAIERRARTTKRDILSVHGTGMSRRDMSATGVLGGATCQTALCIICVACRCISSPDLLMTTCPLTPALLTSSVSAPRGGAQMLLGLFVAAPSLAPRAIACARRCATRAF